MREIVARKIPFFYGWIIVAAAFLSTFVGGGLQSFTFSVFLEPMSESLGWSRTVLTGALALRIVTAASLAPIFGTVVDRYGPRLLMFAAAIVGSIAALLISQVQEIWQFYAVFAFVGISGGAGLGAIVTGATVSKWFVRLRGRALAFTTMGSAAPGLILAPIITAVVFTYGWRVGWVIMSVLFLVLLVPASLLMARQPEDLGLLPDGAKSEEDVTRAYEQRGGLESAYSWTLREAIRTRALWLLVSVQIFSGLAISSVILHEFSFVRGLGYSPAIAAGVLSTHAGFAVAIRPAWGILLERVPVRFVIAAVFSGTSIALVMLLNAHTVWAVFLFAVVYGVSIAGSAVSSAIVYPNYFGRDHVGTIRGFITPFTLPAGALGPLLVSVAYDTSGTYTVAFSSLIGLFIVGAVLILLTKPPVRPIS